MTAFFYRFGTPILGIGCLIMIIMIAVNRQLPDLYIGMEQLQTFKISFISLILEAFPFILLGVIFSALLQVFVTDAMIQRLTPRNPILGVLFGGLLGLLFPLCECGMIPVVRRLIRKGMPAYIGIVYLLAGPIVNPIVYTATYTAFRTTPIIAYMRMGLGFSIAVLIGLVLYKFMRTNPLRETAAAVDPHYHNHSNHHVHHHGNASGPASPKLPSRISSTLGHASDEFFEMGKYLIFGALLTALIQTVLDRDTLASVADGPFTYLFMMGFAFFLSICSTSDAFIASSFSGMFDSGPLLAFLVFGPMVDLKNTLMLLSTFRVRIVIALIVMAGTLAWAGAWITEVFL
ncbi:permease [Paenibacillus sp. GCM10023252]|uniref:permease n=1 Tax=Paenibacillus sp. GCM10023252 TaxID=3252649 RepID=UPI003611AFA2